MNRDTRLIALALLLWGFGEGLFFHIQPLYIEELGADSVTIGGLLSVAAVVRAASLLPAGILADRIPRKWLMIGGWITGLVGVLLVGLARSWQGLLPGLLIYAFSAYCIPVINAYLASAVGGHGMARTFTTVFAGYAAGSVISPSVGGWLAQATTMRVVYFASALLFALSMLAVVQVSPQPVPARAVHSRRWRSLLNGRFLRFAASVCLMFVAMYLSFPLASNFLRDVGDWRIADIGALGSFQALGAALLNPLLGRIGGETEPETVPGPGRELRTQMRAKRFPLTEARGLVAGQSLVWSSALILLLARTFPLLALAYLLRGAYQGCRSLTQAQATALAGEADRGLLLGATETIIASAQIVAPYAAGWLYAGNPVYPLIASLVLIPILSLLAWAAHRS
ncbi:MAG: MFS transporter [Anaerolineae bacterium]|jgi:MFS family permease